MVEFFSKFDLSDAYLQIGVDEKCTVFLTINTHKRLYSFNMLLFGVKEAPDIYQQIMYRMLADFYFTPAHLNDVLIKSETRRQH